MFHNSFRINPDSDEIDETDTSVDMLDSLGNVNSQLGSPGMEHLIEEQEKANLRLKKNVKYNRAFDTAKVAAEYLSHYSTEMFEKDLNAFKQFTELSRVGLPDDLINLLNDNLDTSKPKGGLCSSRQLQVN